MATPQDRAKRVAALGRFLTRTHGQVRSVSVLAWEFSLSEVYVEGVVFELRNRGQLAVTVTSDPYYRPPPMPEPDEDERAAALESSLARLDALLARDTLPHGTSMTSLARQFDLSIVTVRAHVRASGRWIPEHTSPGEGNRWVTVTMQAHRDGVSVDDIARYLHVAPDLVAAVIEQQERAPGDAPAP